MQFKFAMTLPENCIEIVGVLLCSYLEQQSILQLILTTKSCHNALRGILYRSLTVSHGEGQIKEFCNARVSQRFVSTVDFKWLI